MTKHCKALAGDTLLASNSGAKASVPETNSHPRQSVARQAHKPQLSAAAQSGFYRFNRGVRTAVVGCVVCASFLLTTSVSAAPQFSAVTDADGVNSRLGLMNEPTRSGLIFTPSDANVALVGRPGLGRLNTGDPDASTVEIVIANSDDPATANDGDDIASNFSVRLILSDIPATPPEPPAAGVELTVPGAQLASDAIAPGAICTDIAVSSQIAEIGESDQRSAQLTLTPVDDTDSLLPGCRYTINVGVRIFATVDPNTGDASIEPSVTAFVLAIDYDYTERDPTPTSVIGTFNSSVLPDGMPSDNSLFEVYVSGRGRLLPDRLPADADTSVYTFGDMIDRRYTLINGNARTVYDICILLDDPDPEADDDPTNLSYTDIDSRGDVTQHIRVTAARQSAGPSGMSPAARFFGAGYDFSRENIKIITRAPNPGDTDPSVDVDPPLPADLVDPPLSTGIPVDGCDVWVDELPPYSEIDIAFTSNVDITQLASGANACPTLADNISVTDLSGTPAAATQTQTPTFNFDSNAANPDISITYPDGSLVFNTFTEEPYRITISNSADAAPAFFVSVGMSLGTNALTNIFRVNSFSSLRVPDNPASPRTLWDMFGESDDSTENRTNTIRSLQAGESITLTLDDPLVSCPVPARFSNVISGQTTVNAMGVCKTVVTQSATISLSPQPGARQSANIVQFVDNADAAISTTPVAQPFSIRIFSPADQLVAPAIVDSLPSRLSAVPEDTPDTVKDDWTVSYTLPAGIEVPAIGSVFSDGVTTADGAVIPLGTVLQVRRGTDPAADYDPTESYFSNDADNLYVFEWSGDQADLPATLLPGPPLSRTPHFLRLHARVAAGSANPACQAINRGDDAIFMNVASESFPRCVHDDTNVIPVELTATDAQSALGDLSYGSGADVSSTAEIGVACPTPVGSDCGEGYREAELNRQTLIYAAPAVLPSQPAIPLGGNSVGAKINISIRGFEDAAGRPIDNVLFQPALSKLTVTSLDGTVCSMTGLAASSFEPDPDIPEPPTIPGDLQTLLTAVINDGACSIVSAGDNNNQLPLLSRVEFEYAVQYLGPANRARDTITHTAVLDFDDDVSGDRCSTNLTASTSLETISSAAVRFSAQFARFSLDDDGDLVYSDNGNQRVCAQDRVFRVNFSSPGPVHIADLFGVVRLRTDGVYSLPVDDMGNPVDNLRVSPIGIFSNVVAAADPNTPLVACPLQELMRDDGTGNDVVRFIGFRWGTDCTTTTTTPYYTEAGLPAPIGKRATGFPDLIIPVLMQPLPSEETDDIIDAAFAGSVGIFSDTSQLARVPAITESTVDFFADYHNWLTAPVDPGASLTQDFITFPDMDNAAFGPVLGPDQFERTGRRNTRARLISSANLVTVLSTSDSISVADSNPISWTVTVNNTGTGGAYNPSVIQTLPLGLDFVIGADGTDCDSNQPGIQNPKPFKVMVGIDDDAFDYNAILCDDLSLLDSGGDADTSVAVLTGGSYSTTINIVAQADGTSCDFPSPDDNFLRPRAMWGCSDLYIQDVRDPDSAVISFRTPDSTGINVTHLATIDNIDNADDSAPSPDSGTSFCRLCQNGEIRIDITNPDGSESTNLVVTEDLTESNFSYVTAAAGVPVSFQDVPFFSEAKVTVYRNNGTRHMIMLDNVDPANPLFTMNGRMLRWDLSRVWDDGTVLSLDGGTDFLPLSIARSNASAAAATRVRRIVLNFTVLSYDSTTPAAEALLTDTDAPRLRADVEFSRFCSINEPGDVTPDTATSGLQTIPIYEPAPVVLSRAVAAGVNGGADGNFRRYPSIATALSAGRGDVIIHRLSVTNINRATPNENDRTPETSVEDLQLTTANRGLLNNGSFSSAFSQFSYRFVCATENAASTQASALIADPSPAVVLGCEVVGTPKVSVTRNADPNNRVEELVQDVDDPYGAPDQEDDGRYADVPASRNSAGDVYYVGIVTGAANAACEDISLQTTHEWGCEIDGGLGNSPGGGITAVRNAFRGSNINRGNLFLDTTPRREDITAQLRIVPSGVARGVLADPGADQPPIGQRARAQLVFTNNLGANVRDFMFRLSLGGTEYVYDNTDPTGVTVHVGRAGTDAAGMPMVVTEPANADGSGANGYEQMPATAFLVSGEEEDFPQFALVSDPAAEVREVDEVMVPGAGQNSLNLIRDRGANYRFIVEVPLIFNDEDWNDQFADADVRQEVDGNGDPPGDPIALLNANANLSFRDTCGMPIRVISSGSGVDDQRVSVSPSVYVPDLDINILPLDATPAGNVQGDATQFRGLNILLPRNQSQRLRVQVANNFPGNIALSPEIASTGVAREADSVLAVTIGNGLTVNRPPDCVIPADPDLLPDDLDQAPPAPVSATSSVYICTLGDLNLGETANFDFTISRSAPASPDPLNPTPPPLVDDLTFRADVQGRLTRGDGDNPIVFDYSRDSIVARIVGLAYVQAITGCTHHALPSPRPDPNPDPDPSLNLLQTSMLIGEDCELTTRVEFFGLGTPGFSSIVNTNITTTAPTPVVVDSVSQTSVPDTLAFTTVPAAPLVTPGVSSWSLALTAPRSGTVFSSAHRHRLLNVDANAHGNSFNLSTAVNFTVNFAASGGGEFGVSSTQWINHPDLDVITTTYEVIEPPPDSGAGALTLSSGVCIESDAAACAAADNFADPPADSPESVQPNTNLRFRFEISNPGNTTGRSPAYNLRLSDEVPCLNIANAADDGLDNDGDGLLDARPDAPDGTDDENDGLTVTSDVDCQDNTLRIDGNPDFASYAANSNNILNYRARVSSGVLIGQQLNINHNLVWESLPPEPPDGAPPAGDLAIDPAAVDAGEVNGARVYQLSTVSELQIPPPIFVLEFLPGLSITDAVDHPECSDVERPPSAADADSCTGTDAIGERNVQMAAIGEEIELRFLSALPPASYPNLTFGIDLPADMSCIALNTSNTTGGRSRGEQTYTLPAGFAPGGAPTSVTCSDRTIRWIYGDQVQAGADSVNVGLRAWVAIDNRNEFIDSRALPTVFNIGDNDAFVSVGSGDALQSFSVNSPIRIRRSLEPTMLFSSKTWLDSDGNPLSANAAGVIEAEAGDIFTVQVEVDQTSAPLPWNFRAIDRLSTLERNNLPQFEYVDNSVAYCGAGNPLAGATLPVVSEVDDNLIFTWAYDPASAAPQVYPIELDDSIRFCYQLEVTINNQPNQLITDSFDDDGVAINQTSQIAWSSVSSQAGVILPAGVTRSADARPFGDANGPRTGDTPNENDRPNIYEADPGNQNNPDQFLPPSVLLPLLSATKTAINDPATVANCLPNPTIGSDQCMRLRVIGPSSTIAGLTLTDIVALPVNTSTLLVPPAPGQNPAPVLTYQSSVTPAAVQTYTQPTNTQTWTWNSNIVVDTQDPGDDEVLNVLYRARVQNDAQAQAGVAIDTGEFTVRYNDGADVDAAVPVPTQSTTAPAIDAIVVHEPAVTISQTVTNITRTTGLNVGDVIRVELILSAEQMVDGVAGTTAYDTEVFARIPAEFTYSGDSVVATLTNNGVDTDLVVPSVLADGVIRFGQNGVLDIPPGIPPNTSVTMRYQLTANNTIQPLQSLQIQNGAIWSSQDGTGVLERDGSNCLQGTPAFPTTPTAGQLNDYCTLLDAFSFSSGDRTRLTTVVDDGFDVVTDGITRIGDVVEFSTLIRMSEGITPSVRMSVQLPAGLSLVNGAAGDFSVSFVAGADTVIGDLSTAIAAANYVAPVDGASAWTVSFGDVANTDTDTGTDENIRVIWRAQVLNDDSFAVTASSDRTVPITVLYQDADDGEQTMAMNVLLDVRQPVLSIASVSSATNPGITAASLNSGALTDADRTISFTTQVCNAPGAAPAYDVTISSRLPPQFDRTTIEVEDRNVSLFNPADGTSVILNLADYAVSPPSTDPADTNTTFPISDRTAIFFLTLNDNDDTTPTAGIPSGQCLRTEFSVKTRESIGIGNEWTHDFSVVDYYSLDSGDVNALERREYTVDDNAEFVLRTPIEFPLPPSKALVGASAPRYATIGEIIDYQLTVSSDETPYLYAMFNARVTTVLPVHLQRVLTAPLTVVFVPAGVSLSLNSANSTISRFVVDIDTLDAKNQAVFNYQTQVANTPVVQAGIGADLFTTASMSFESDNGSGVVFPRASDNDAAANALRSSEVATGTVIVVEPELAITRRFYRQNFDALGTLIDQTEITADITELDAGDRVVVSIELAAAGDEGADNFFSDAFDIALVDNLPGNVSFVPGSTVTVAPDGSTQPFTAPTTVANDAFLTWDSNANPAIDIDIEEGEQFVLNYVVELGDATQPNEILSFTAQAQWTSLDGVVAGERTGAGTGSSPDDYRQTATEAIVVSEAADMALTLIRDTYDSGVAGADADGQVRVGDLIEYQLTWSVQEGTTENASVIAELPLGVTYVGVSELSVDGNILPNTSLALADLQGIVADGEADVRPTTVEFALGDIVNSGTTDSGESATDDIRINFYVRTLNGDVFNQEPLEQGAVIAVLGSYNNRLAALRADNTIRILQPLLSTAVSFTVPPIRTEEYMGRVGLNDVIDWMITLDNNAPAPAYNPIFEMTIPETSRSVMLNGGTYEAELTITDSADNTISTTTLSTNLPDDFMATGMASFTTTGVEIPPNGDAVLSYETVITNTVGAEMSLPNTSRVAEYFSLDSADLPTIAELPEVVTAEEDYGPVEGTSEDLTALTPAVTDIPILKEIPAIDTVSIGQPIDYQFSLPQSREATDSGIYAEVALYDVRLSDAMIDAAANRYLRYIEAEYMASVDSDGNDVTLNPAPVLVNVNPANDADALIQGTPDSGGLDVLAGTQAQFRLQAVVRNQPLLNAGDSFINSASFVYNRLDNLDNPTSDQVVDGGSGDSPAMTIIEPDLEADDEDALVFRRGQLPQGSNDLNALVDFPADNNVLTGDLSDPNIRFDRGVTNRVSFTISHSDTSTGPAYEISTAFVLPRNANPPAGSANAVVEEIGVCDFNPIGEDAPGVVVDILSTTVNPDGSMTTIATSIPANELGLEWQQGSCTLLVAVTSTTALEPGEQLRIRFSTRLDEQARDGYGLNIQARLEDYSSYSPGLYGDAVRASLGEANIREHIRTYPLDPNATVDNTRVNEIGLTVEAPEIVMLKQAVNLTARNDFFRRDFSTHVNATTAQAGDRIQYIVTLINIGSLGIGPGFVADRNSLGAGSALSFTDTPGAQDGGPPADVIWARGTMRDEDIEIFTGTYEIPASGALVITPENFDAIPNNLSANNRVDDFFYTITPGTANPGTVDSFSVNNFDLPGTIGGNAGVVRFQFVVRIRGDAPDRAIAVNQSSLTGVPGLAELLSHQYRDRRQAPINTCYDLADLGDRAVRPGAIRPDCVPAPEPEELETEVLSLPVISMKKRVFDLDDDGIFAIGDIVRYEIVAVNLGSVDSTQTRLIDHLPAGTAYVANSTYLNGEPVADRPRAGGEDEQDQRFVSPLEEGLVIQAIGFADANAAGSVGRMPRSRSNGGSLDDEERIAIVSFDATIEPDQIRGSLIINQAFSDGASELAGIATGPGSGNDATQTAIEEVCRENNITGQLCDDYLNFSIARLSYISPPSDDPTTEAPNDPTVFVVGDGPRMTATKEVIRKELNGASDEVDATDTFTYRIILQNDGPVPLTGVRVADPIPDEMVYLPGTTELTMATKVANEAGEFETSSVTLQVPDITADQQPAPPFGIDENDALLVASTGQLPTTAAEAIINPGESAILSFDVRVLSNRRSDQSVLVTGDIISNQAQIFSDQLPDLLSDIDGDPSNGYQPTQLVYGGGQLLVARRQLSLVNGRLALPGNQLEHRITLTNVGSLAVADLLFVDSLAQGRDQVEYVRGSFQVNGRPILESSADNFSRGCINSGSSLLQRISQTEPLFYNPDTGVLELNYGLISSISISRSVTFSYRTRILPTATPGREIRFEGDVQWERDIDNQVVPIDNLVGAGVVDCERQTDKSIDSRVLSASMDVGGAPGVAIISGSVWRDLNHNRVFDDAGSGGAGNPDDIARIEVGEQGWLVDLLFKDPEAGSNEAVKIASRTIDEDGEYRFIGLTPSSREALVVGNDNNPGGGEYSLRFIPLGFNPNYAIVGIPDYPDNGRGDNRGFIPVAEMAINEIAVDNNRNYVNLNMPVDPNGIIYDSVTRVPVPDARVSLYRVDSAPVVAVGAAAIPAVELVPPSCFVDTKQANQTVSTQGYYRFDLNFFNEQCPNDARYLIFVTPPLNDLFLPRFPSVVINPTNTVDNSVFNAITQSVPSPTLLPLDIDISADRQTLDPFPVNVCISALDDGTIIEDAVEDAPELCEIASSHLLQPAQVPSRAGADADVQYALHLRLDNSITGVPGAEIDKGRHLYQNNIPLDPNLANAVAVSKSTPLTNVVRGQLVPYNITLRNTLIGPLVLLRIEDHMPPGFKYVADSALLDGELFNPSRISGNTLFWDDVEINSGQTRTLQLILIVGGGVLEGEYVNTARTWEDSTRQYASRAATATVRVVPDPLFDCADIIGRVFDDKDRNASLDRGEPGIPGVRLVTTSGLLITTDQYGRFHIPCPIVPNIDRGSNFFVKLDEQTLPSGYRMTTSNPRVLRATRGKMIKYNFGASLHRIVRLDLSDPAFVLAKEDLEPLWLHRIDQLVEELRGEPSILRITYLGEHESERLARRRTRVVRDLVQEQWKEQQCCYNLEFEIEIFWRLGRPGEIDEEFVPLPVDIRTPDDEQSDDEPKQSELPDSDTPQEEGKMTPSDPGDPPEQDDLSSNPDSDNQSEPQTRKSSSPEQSSINFGTQYSLSSFPQIATTEYFSTHKVDSSTWVLAPDWKNDSIVKTPMEILFVAER